MSAFCAECKGSGESGQYGILDCQKCTAATERAALDTHLLALGRLHERDLVWEAYKLGQAKAVPAGFALVPVEPTDEMLRMGLSVDMPATFRGHLRNPLNGPNTAADVEKMIAIAVKRYRAMLSVATPANNNTEKADE